MFLVFDIGGSSIKISTCTKKGEILTKTSVATPSKYGKFLKIIEEEIIKGDYEGIAFSSPGSVNSKTGEILGISAVEYIHENNFSKYISEKYGLNVSIENDANCSALGEVYFSDEKINSALFLTIGTGIGGAIIYNGRLINGKNNEAGEFGYMKFDETGENLSLFTLPNITKKIKEKYNINLTPFEVFNKYFDKVEPFYSEVDNAFNKLEIAIYNLRYFFDPDVLIIGGAISEDKRYIKELQKRCKYIKIRACKMFNTNNILGALANHLQKNYVR